MAKITGWLVDVNAKLAGSVEFEPCLEEYRRMLECDLIDIVTFSIRGRVYDIVCDDEGTFKAEPYISAINDMGEAMLVGNLLVVGIADEEGRETNLSEDDIKHLSKYTMMMQTVKHTEPYPMLVQVEYA